MPDNAADRIKLSDFELGWLVGILEGEANFRYGDNKTQRIWLGTTDEDVADHCAMLFSKLTGKEFNVTPRPPREDYKQVFVLAASGESARTIMRAVVPYMSKHRRAQIWRALNKYNLVYQKVDMDAIVNSISVAKNG